MITRILFIFYCLPLLVLGQECIQSVTEVNGQRISCKGDLIFEDDFKFLDLLKWKRTVRFGGDDYDFVIYGEDKENSYISDGKLVVKPTLMDERVVTNGTVSLERCTEQAGSTDCTQTAQFFNILPPIKSAQYCTSQSFSFKYGTVTISAKFPSGDWVMPQLWLKPKEKVYGERYMSGKVRIASSRGNEDLKTSAGEDIGATILESGILVSRDPVNSPVKARTARLVYVNPLFEKWHNYTFVWKPDDLIFIVDGNINHGVSIIDQFSSDLISSTGFSLSDNLAWRKGSRIAPFDEEFYICLGVSVGGNFGFPDGSVSKGKPKPWGNLKIKGLLDFWRDRDNWYSTWSDGTSLQVDHVTVTAV